MSNLIKSQLQKTICFLELVPWRRDVEKGMSLLGLYLSLVSTFAIPSSNRGDRTEFKIH